MGWFRSLFFPPPGADHLLMPSECVSAAILLTKVWFIKKNKLGKRKLRKPNPTSEPFSRADCSAHHLAHQQGTGILVNFMQPQSLNYGFPRFCRISSIRPTDSRKSPQTKHILSSVRTGPQCSKCSSAGCRLFWAANKISFLLFRGLFFHFLITMFNIVNFRRGNGTRFSTLTDPVLPFQNKGGRKCISPCNVPGFGTAHHIFLKHF
jgi:hypothetical protein